MSNVMNWIASNYLRYMINFIILFIGIFHLGLPIAVDIAVATLFLFFITSYISSIVTFVSLIIGILICSSFVTNESIFYRPHEKFQTYSDAYLSNVNVSYSMPYGDLGAFTIN